MKFKTYFLTTFIVLLFSNFNGQEYNINTLNGQTVSACSGTFVDEGGSTGDYSNGGTQTITFKNDNGGGVCLNFSEWDIDYSLFGYGSMFFYDGSDASAPLIMEATGDWTTGGSMPFTGPGMVCSSGGDLTVVFNPDGSSGGWQAEVSCFDVLPETSDCNVNATADVLTICPGDQVNLSATGNIVNVPLSNDFNNSTIGSDWSSSVTARFDNPCDASLDGTPYLWMGSVPSPRSLISNSYDLSQGGVISFEIDFAKQAQSAPCEGPDESDEGVYLQYSIDNGTSWTTIHYFFPSHYTDGSEHLQGWKKYYFNVPPAAQTTATQLRWHQENISSNTTDNWGIDNVTISTPTVSSISWDNGLGNGANHTVSPTGSTTYTATITDGSTSCQQSVSVVVDPNCSGGSACGDCSSATCPINNRDISGNNFSSCQSLNDISNETVVSYHTVTASSDGTLGLVQEVGSNWASCSNADADATLGGRTVKLFAVGDCGGTEIAPDISNGGQSSTFNPEWENLTPGATYIVEMTNVISACVTSELCLDFYWPSTPTCATCATVTPSCEVNSVIADNISDARSDLTAANIAGSEFNQVFTPGGSESYCVPVSVPNGSTVIGFKHGIDYNDLDCVYDLSYELRPIDCSAPLTPSRTNGQGVASGFNPEWDNLTPGDYVLCYSANLQADMFCNDNFELDALGYYNVVPNTPPAACATCATVTPSCEVNSVIADNISDARSDLTAANIAGSEFNQVFTPGGSESYCVPVSVPNGSTVLGFKHGIDYNDLDCVYDLSYELRPVDCSAPLTPSRTNGQGVASGFNPEWDNLTPGDYVLCYSANLQADMLCNDNFELDALGYYNVVPQDCPVDINIDKVNIACFGENNGSIDITSVDITELSFSWTGPNGFVSDQSNLTNLEAGIYEVVVTRTTASSCTSQVTEQIEIIEGISPNVNNTSSTDANNCSLDNGSITITSDGTNFTILDSLGNKIDSNTVGTFNNLVAGDYTVVVWLGNCFTTEVVTINSSPVNVPDAGNDSVISRCISDEDFDLSTLVSVAGGSFTDNGNDLFNLSSGSFITINQDGTTQYLYIVSNSCFADTAYLTVTGNVLPTIVVDQIQDGSSYYLTVTGADNYTWSPSTFLDCDNCDSPISTPEEDITYTITGTNSNGCISSTSISLSAIKTMVIPNIITPNSDGTNDLFVIKTNQDYVLRIYNRWGNLVHEATQDSDPWDGTSNGTAVNEGTYYYQVETTEQTYTGTLTLLR